MNLAVSNIAWNYSEVGNIIDTLKEHAVDKIEVAPLALFNKPLEEVSEQDIADVRALWQDAGIEIVAMQALLFGKPELTLFKSQEKRAELFKYLQLVVDVAAAVGARPLVFGSPKNRLRGEMPLEQAMHEAAPFMRDVASYAHERGCILCMEPNAAGYGCDFITHHFEAFEFVSMVDHPGCAVQIDAGVMGMNNETSADIVENMELVAHVHCSEPYLEAVGGASVQRHEDICAALCSSGYDGLVSIEMKRDNDEDNRNHVVDALKVAKLAYKDYFTKGV